VQTIVTLGGPPGSGQTPLITGLLPGTYTVTETLPNGWATNDVLTKTVSVGINGTGVVTFNNTAQGNLRIVKNTTGGNGTFTFTTAGPSTVLEQVIVTVGNTGTTPLITGILPGTYTVTEGALSTGWLSNDSSMTKTVTVDIGGTGVVTFNNRATAHLTLIKTVTNDNGGTELPTAWTLYAAGPTPISGPGGVAETLVTAGSYALSESSGPGGYTAGPWSCVGGAQTGANIALALNESAVCTINNDDQPGKLTIIKKTNPANNPTVFNFESSFGTGTGGGVTYPYTFTLTGDTGSNSKTFTLDQQPPLYVKEVLGPDSEWRLTKIHCTGGKKNVEVDLATGLLTINIVVGDDMKCTFWNELPRMTGGGWVLQTADFATATVPAGVKISHGFELYCGVAAKKRANNLEVNWSSVTNAKSNNKSENAFHMNNLLSVTCDGVATTGPKNDLGGDPDVPNAPFNRYIGSGTGNLNKGKPGTHYAEWVLVDNGEPGSFDTFSLTVWKAEFTGGNLNIAATKAAAPLITFGTPGVVSPGPTFLPDDGLWLGGGSTSLGPISGGGNHQAH
jgi:hypothetical protein